MKKISIALDYNPSAEKIAKLGYAYAKALGAQTTLVHVISDAVYYAIDYAPFMGYESSFYNTNLEVAEELKNGAANFLSTSALHLGNKDIKTAVLEGDTADALLDYVTANNIDLLVIGTHSRNALESVLMGNTAVKVVKHTKIPLLIVPTRN